jgi:hypothetical protein
MENTSILVEKNLNMSDEIGKLAESLAKAQSVIEGAKKDASNPFFKSSYSTLSSVWDACRKPLSDNGLSVVQTTEFMPEHPDMVCIETILCHSSGQWIKGKLAVKPVKADPQSVGSCITYLRRYSLQSMVGIAPEDDDGNAASGKNDTKNEAKKEVKEIEQPKDEFISMAQKNRLFAIAKATVPPWPTEELKLYLIHEYGIESSAAIPKAKYDEVIKYVENHCGYEVKGNAA